MTRYRFRKHARGGHTTTVDIPLYLPNGSVGAIRVAGTGDDAIESLGIANNIADQITSDPVLAAIMPPQVQIAIAAVKGLHAAAEASGDAGIKKELAKYSGDGAKRVAKALGADTTKSADKSSDKSKKGSDVSKSTTTGFYGLPSVGDIDDDDTQPRRRRKRRRGKAFRYYDEQAQEGANYGNEEWERMHALVDSDLDAGNCVEHPGADPMLMGLAVGAVHMPHLKLGDMEPEDFSQDPTFQEEQGYQQAFAADDNGYGPQYATPPYPMYAPQPYPYPYPDPSQMYGGYPPYGAYPPDQVQQQGYDQYGNPTTTPDGNPWPVDNFGNPLPADSNGYPITPAVRPTPKATVTRIGKGGSFGFSRGAEKKGKLTKGAAVYAGGGGAGGGGGGGNVYNASTGQYTPKGS